MADRVPYSTRGGSIGGLPSVSVPSGAGLLAQTGQAVQKILADELTYSETLKRQMVNQAVARGRVKLAELESQFEADPDKFNNQAAAYRSGLVKGLDPISAKIIDEEMTLTQRTYAIRVRDRFNAVKSDEMRGANAAIIEQNVSYFGQNGITPDTAIQLNSFLGDMDKLLDGQGPDGSPLYSGEQKVSAKQNLLRTLADNEVRRYIRTADAAEAKEIENQLREGSFQIMIPSGDDSHTNLAAILPDRIDTYINTAQERQRELERGREKASVAQILRAVNNRAAWLTDLRSNGSASTATLAPEDVAIAYGEDNTDIARMILEGKEAVAYHDGYAATPAQRDTMFDAADALDQASMLEAFAQAQNDIKADAVQYLLNTDESVRSAYNQMHRERQPDFTGPQQGTEPYIAALNAAYSARGIQPSQRRILSKSQAESLAGAIVAPKEDGTPKSNREIHAELSAVTSQYGSAAQRVMHELYGEKISGKYLVVSDMHGTAASKALDAFDQQDFLVKNLKGYDTTVADIQESVTQQKLYNELVRSLPSGFSGEADRYLETAKALAMKYLVDGDANDAESAAKKAVKDVIPYKFEDRVRVPVSVHNDAIGAAVSPGAKQQLVDDIAESIDFSDTSFFGAPITSALDRKEAVQRIREGGHFITNGDETGVVLVTAGGNAVRLKSGNRVEFTWDELTRRGAEIAETRRKDIKKAKEDELILRGALGGF